jgi:hypothetical protein
MRCRASLRVLLVAAVGVLPLHALADDPDPALPTEPPPTEAPPAPPAELPAPPPPSELAVPPEEPEEAPEGEPAEPPLTASPPEGQWVATSQYGWIWSPYAQAYTFVPSEGYPAQFVYGRSLGWRWVIAPWVLGWGPQPRWGLRGRGHYVWYTRPWFQRRELHHELRAHVIVGGGNARMHHVVRAGGHGHRR